LDQTYSYQELVQRRLPEGVDSVFKEVCF
jgi:hypothetical protein